MNERLPRVLTFSGPGGTGKTSITRFLAEQIGYNRVGFGDYIRASVSNGELLDATRRGKGFEKEVDSWQIKEILEGEGKIVDGRLAGIWARKLISEGKLEPEEVTTFLVICESPNDRNERFRRIAEREGIPLQQAIEETRGREQSNSEQWQRVYPRMRDKLTLENISNPNNYDYTINTAGKTEKQVWKEVLALPIIQLLAQSRPQTGRRRLPNPRTKPMSMPRRISGQ